MVRVAQFKKKESFKGDEKKQRTTCGGRLQTGKDNMIGCIRDKD